MLTPEEKEEIKKLLIKGLSNFRVAIETDHSRKTVKKVKCEMYEELEHSQAQAQVAMLEDFTIIPLEAGFLAELLLDKAINPEAQVFVPVPTETAEEFFRIEKMFKELDPILKQAAEAIKEGIDMERSKLGDAK